MPQLKVQKQIDIPQMMLQYLRAFQKLEFCCQTSPVQLLLFNILFQVFRHRTPCQNKTTGQQHTHIIHNTYELGCLIKTVLCCAR